jgi:predicted unusual protein kinase regulating ubiquinone biosynthesis (AarF/ABC1/UbiB family)
MAASTPSPAPLRPAPIGTDAGTSILPPLRPTTAGVRFKLRASGVEPAARLLACLAGIALHGLMGALGDRLKAAAERPARRAARQRRAAASVAATLGALRGAYVKLGQFAALRYDVLPAWLRDGLANLHDRVPPLPLAVILGVVESELGRPVSQTFERFDPQPLGAASIAQVHRARLPSGEEVAVKVQHPWLEASLGADLALLRGLLALFTRLTGRSRAAGQRLFDEFALTLREELDFLHEADVAREIAQNLAFEPQIVVPTIVASLTTRRVLTMSYHPAVAINNRGGLARLGVTPAAVLETLARAYAKQVFVDGLFHADPHPGNLFVLDEPGAAARPRVLFVDFGLSRRLAPELRREMRHGLFALLQRDLDGFVGGMDRMGMIAPGAEPGVREAVGAMFERLRAEAASPLGLSGDQVLSLKDEAKRLLQQTPGLQLPNDLLLYAKTLSYLFALGAELDPSVDLVKRSVPYLLQFLAART